MVKKKYVVTYQIKRSVMGKTYILKGEPVKIEAGTFKEARQIFKDNNKSTPKNKAINIKVLERDLYETLSQEKTPENKEGELL